MTSLAAPSRRVLPPWPLAMVGIVACAAAATAAPLLTYTLTLAVFGGAHVLGELRFVEARFAARLPERLLWGLGALLAGVVALRLIKNLGLWGGVEATRTELVIVAGLAALTLPGLARVGGRALAICVGVVTAVSIGLLTAPIWTMLTLACLHNFTPVGFLADGLTPRERPYGLALVAIAFGAVPLAIATGAPTAALDAVGASLPDLSLLPSSDRAEHFRAYLHRSVHDASWAPAVFSALVFTQCMHYAAVLGVLPRIAPGGPAAPRAVGLSRIPTRAFVAGVVVLSAVALVGYALDFKVARSWYGLIAAVHAWVEVPLLLMALAPLAQKTRPALAAR